MIPMIPMIPSLGPARTPALPLTHSGGPLALEPDPPSTHGEVYEIQPAQPPLILKARGDTRADGHDVPADAIVGNTVVVGVEGIQGKPASYARMLSTALQTDGPLHQPIVMVHEGIEASLADAGKRIDADDDALRQLDAGQHLTDAQVFDADPAVRSTYDLARQVLDQGHDLVLLVHSGGGKESALALTYAASQNETERAEISQHVRVVSLAGASPVSDYAGAGVDAGHILYTCDSQDPVARAVLAGGDPTTVRQHLSDAVQSFSEHPQGFLAHLPGRIASENEPEIAAFLAGGAGGVHIASAP